MAFQEMMTSGGAYVVLTSSQIAERIIKKEPKKAQRIIDLYCLIAQYSKDIDYNNHQDFLDKLWSYDRLASEFFPELYDEHENTALAVVKNILRRVPGNLRKEASHMHAKFRGYRTVEEYHPGFCQLNEEERQEAVRESNRVKGANNYSPEQIKFILLLAEDPSFRTSKGKDRKAIANMVASKFRELQFFNENCLDILVRRFGSS